MTCTCTHEQSMNHISQKALQSHPLYMKHCVVFFINSSKNQSINQFQISECEAKIFTESPYNQLLPILVLMFWERGCFAVYISGAQD